MPQAVRLLCPWDRHVDARSAWAPVNSIQQQPSFPFKHDHSMVTHSKVTVASNSEGITALKEKVDAPLNQKAAAKRRNLNSPARKYRESGHRKPSPLQRTAPRLESTR